MWSKACYKNLRLILGRQTILFSGKHWPSPGPCSLLLLWNPCVQVPGSRRFLLHLCSTAESKCPGGKVLNLCRSDPQLLGPVSTPTKVLHCLSKARAPPTFPQAEMLPRNLQIRMSGTHLGLRRKLQKQTRQRKGKLILTCFYFLCVVVEKLGEQIQQIQAGFKNLRLEANACECAPATRGSKGWVGEQEWPNISLNRVGNRTLFSQCPSLLQLHTPTLAPATPPYVQGREFGGP